MLKLIAVAIALLVAQAAALRVESHDAMVPNFGTVYCDGNNGKCKTKLKFGANNYWAVWRAHITTNPPK
jgi:hypothetical protein